MKPSELFTEITGKDYLFNIQPINNIPSIMKRGLLSYDSAANIYHTSIAMKDVQIKRGNKTIPNGMSIHKHACLYFSFWNPMLCAKKSINTQICILVFDGTVLDIENVVVSDQNAASYFASFYSPEEGLKRIDFETVYAQYWTDSNKLEQKRKKSIKCAEVLVPYRIPYEYVLKAVVYNDEAKRLLIDNGFDKEIDVRTDCFF